MADVNTANVPVNLVEAVDRRVRTTTSGMEITTVFYVEPASAAPIVVCALLGRVDTTTNPPSRVLPAADFEYPFCYCVEARPAPVDRRSAASSPTMLGGNFSTQTTFGNVIAGLGKQIIFDGPYSLDGNGKYTATNQPEMCGVHIEAVYRPLPTIYSEDAARFDPSTWQTPANAFDYIDPQFYPASRTFPANGYPGQQNGFCMKDALLGTPVAAPNPGNTSLLITETWQEITIRRVMCPSVPWDTIRQLTNRINGQKAWTPANMTIPGLPNNTFPVGTLRFDSAEPIKRTLPTCFNSSQQLITNALAGGGDKSPSTTFMTWWDIVYKFSWRTTYDLWHPYTRTGDQVPNGPEYIPWNCDWYIGALAGSGNDSVLDILPGWFEMVFEQPTNIVISFNTRRKYLDAEDTTLPINKAPDNTFTVDPGSRVNHPFDTLFLNGAP